MKPRRTSGKPDSKPAASKTETNQRRIGDNRLNRGTEPRIETEVNRTGGTALQANQRIVRRTKTELQRREKLRERESTWTA
jgi:hypothetical protein